jgi:DNA-binding response OmpR family regulator
MLTAKDTDEDYISGLSLGSDDYFTKPFSLVRLTMRVKAIFRRADMYAPKKTGEASTAFEDITVFPSQMSALCHGEELHLTKTELSLLTYLIENKSKAVSRHELLNVIWGYDVIVESRATDDTVKRLRRKLENAGSRVVIETVWGFGFKLGTKAGACK